jgi:hypothetical protein
VEHRKNPKYPPEDGLQNGCSLGGSSYIGCRFSFFGNRMLLKRVMGGGAMRLSHLVLAALLVSAQLAHGEVLTFQVTGTVDGVYGDLTTLGTTFTGTFTYDTAATPYDNASGTSYYHGLSPMTFSSGGFSYHNGSLPGCGVENDLPLADPDGMLMTWEDGFFTSIYDASGTVQGAPPCHFVRLTYSFFDYSGMVFNTADLPSSLDLAQFQQHDCLLNGCDAEGTVVWAAGGAITDVSLVPAPEPSTLALLLTASFGPVSLALHRRRRGAKA